MILFDEEDLLPLSALQHLVFCPRQCALIHLEGVWQENVLTAEGRQMHERTDQAGVESRGEIRIARSVRIRSLRLGLSGKADVVEFHRQPDGSWHPFPVEYKHGRPKIDRCDEVQLCAQAMCLEEMLGIVIGSGALFYGQTKRRHSVQFDQTLREMTTNSAEDLHRLIESRKTPAAEPGPKCESCSVRDLCLPKSTSVEAPKVTRWLQHQIDGLDASPHDGGDH